MITTQRNDIIGITFYRKILSCLQTLKTMTANQNPSLKSFCIQSNRRQNCSTHLYRTLSSVGLDTNIVTIVILLGVNWPEVDISLYL